MSAAVVGRCIGCFHDFGNGPCGGCGASAGPCPISLALRWGSAACDHTEGHREDHRQKRSGRVWTTEEARLSWLEVDDA